MTHAPFNPLKAALLAGKTQVGVWLGAASPVVAEIAGRVGFDWCLIDGEHGPNDATSILAQLQALAATGTPAVVRVLSAEDYLIKQALDLGAQTLLIPMVNTAEHAQRMVSAALYAPQGNRGVGAMLGRAAEFSGLTDYMKSANDQVCVIIQVETAQAMENLPQIAAVDGVDAIFIGPADLSADMGHPDNAAHPEVVAAIEKGFDQIAAAGKASGIIALDTKGIAHYRDKGVNFLGVGADTIALYNTLKDIKNLAQP